MPHLRSIFLRRVWDALAAKYRYLLPVYPVTDVYIHHGASFAPDDVRDQDGDGIPDEEERIARAYQRHHMFTRGWSDIAYNFLVGLSGSILEGRGWRHQGGATGSPYDRHSLSICAIGNFQTQEPTEEMVQAIIGWIITGIELGHIAPDVRIHGHRDASSTSCPGFNLYQHLPRIRSEVRDGRVHQEETVEGPYSGWHEHIAQAPDGTKDEAMRLWQHALWQFGYLDITEVDGVKGPSTRAANKEFERVELGNENPNGRPGAAAWALLLQGPQPEVIVHTETIEVVPAEAIASAEAARDQAAATLFILNSYDDGS